MRTPEQSPRSSRRPRKCGQFRVALPVQMEAGVLWVRPTEHGRIKRLLAFAKKILRAFGPFKLDSKVLPECGSFIVDVLDASDSGDANFDPNAFDRYCKDVDQFAQRRRDERRDSTAENRQALEDVKDALGNVDVAAIEKILLDMESEGVVLLGLPGGPPVQIGFPGAKGSRKHGTATDHLDIEVVSIAHLMHVATDQHRSYLVDDVGTLDLQRGDAVRVHDENMVTCSVADAATPPPEQLDLLLEGGRERAKPDAMCSPLPTGAIREGSLERAVMRSSKSPLLKRGAASAGRRKSHGPQNVRKPRPRR